MDSAINPAGNITDSIPEANKASTPARPANNGNVTKR